MAQTLKRWTSFAAEHGFSVVETEFAELREMAKVTQASIKVARVGAMNPVLWGWIEFNGQRVRAAIGANEVCELAHVAFGQASAALPAKDLAPLAERFALQANIDFGVWRHSGEQSDDTARLLMADTICKLQSSGVRLAGGMRLIQIPCGGPAEVMHMVVDVRDPRYHQVDDTEEITMEPGRWFYGDINIRPERPPEGKLPWFFPSQIKIGTVSAEALVHWGCIASLVSNADPARHSQLTEVDFVNHVKSQEGRFTGLIGLVRNSDGNLVATGLRPQLDLPRR